MLLCFMQTLLNCPNRIRQAKFLHFHFVEFRLLISFNFQGRDSHLGPIHALQAIPEEGQPEGPETHSSGATLCKTKVNIFGNCLF
jgi:hypothetical protein